MNCIRTAGLFAIALTLAACGGGESSQPSAPPAAAGLSVEVTPASAIAFPGSGRLLTVTLTRSGGFTADVTVALDNPPAGVRAEALVFPGTVATLTLPLTLDADVPPGNLGLALNASGGGLSVGAIAQLSVQAAQPAAQDLIAAALAAKTIDRDTALLYRLYALAGDPRLPEAYVGSGSAEEDLRVFGQAEAALPQMSAEMQAVVNSFLVRPDHPDSVYRRPGTSARVARLSATPGQRARAAAPPPSTCAAGAQWRSVRSATIPVRVWSECYADAFLTDWNSALADKDLQVFEKIWPGMTALMGAPRLDGEAIFDAAGKDITDNGGDDAIDVYLVASYSLSRASRPINTAAVGSAVGFAQPAGKCVTNSAGTLSCSGYMVLPAANAGTRPQRSTIIHEFFHVLQFSRNTSLVFVEDWFYEASATWAESHFDRVLPWDPKVALTEVHSPRFKRFVTPGSTGYESVNATVGLRPYSSYIWPFFLEQETGSGVIIGQIWTALQSAMTAADEDRIVDAAYGFDANFHRFALRNVNEELLPGNPVPKRYIDLAGVANGVKQFPDGEVKPEYVTSTLSAGSEATRAFLMAPWSAAYEKFMINRGALPNRVEFDFSGLSNRGGLKLDALIRTTTAAGDEWVREPVVLNPESKAVFCFELGTSTPTVRGEFNELRLVLSNSSRDLTVSGQVIVRPTKKPCGTWDGFVDSSSVTVIDIPGLQRITTTITSTTEIAFEFDEQNSDSGLRAFKVRAGSYVYRSVSEVTGAGACRTVQDASGPIHPQATPTDFSDGATVGNLGTFVSSAGKPQYITPDRVISFDTLTQVSNCTSSGRQETSMLPMSALPLWVPEQQVFDLGQGAELMEETISVTRGPTTLSSRWRLTKKSE